MRTGLRAGCHQAGSDKNRLALSRLSGVGAQQISPERAVSSGWRDNGRELRHVWSDRMHGSADSKRDTIDIAVEALVRFKREFMR